MCWQREQALPCEPASGAVARRLCARWLAEAVGTSAVTLPEADVAQLVVTELITNAVRAGSHRAVFALDVHQDRLRVGVTDDGAGMPAAQLPSTTRIHGRGLQIVESLALAWGTSAVPHGKVVWAELSLPVELTSNLECTNPRS